MMNTFETTEPLGDMPLIIVSIAGKTIAMWTEWNSILVIAALQASVRIFIILCMTNTDRAQRMKVVVNKLQDFFHAFARVTEYFTDFEIRKALVKFVKTGNSEQVVIAVGGRAWTGQCPKQRKPIVNDVEGFGLVAEVMFAVGGALSLVFFGRIGIGSVWLIGASVIHISCLWIAPGGEATMIVTGGCVTRAAFLACQPRGTLTFC